MKENSLPFEPTETISIRASGQIVPAQAEIYDQLAVIGAPYRDRGQTQFHIEFFAVIDIVGEGMLVIFNDLDVARSFAKQTSDQIDFSYLHDQFVGAGFSDSDWEVVNWISRRASHEGAVQVIRPKVTKE